MDRKTLGGVLLVFGVIAVFGAVIAPSIEILVLAVLLLGGGWILRRLR